MNYKLAKQLKDAGFPQSFSEEGGSVMDKEALEKKGEFESLEDKHWVYIPTLSELIEACGEGMKFELIRAQAGWCAKTRGIMILNQETPQEAVAKLWLKLNI